MNVSSKYGDNECLTVHLRLADDEAKQIALLEATRAKVSNHCTTFLAVLNEQLDVPVIGYRDHSFYATFSTKAVLDRNLSSQTGVEQWVYAQAGLTFREFCRD